MHPSAHDRSLRLHRYLAVAATGVTAAGAGVANAAIVTSTSTGWPGAFASVDNVVGTVGARENLSLGPFGDTRLNAVLRVKLIQGGNVGSNRVGKVSGSTSGIHGARLASGAVIGAGLGWSTSSAVLAKSLVTSNNFAASSGAWSLGAGTGANTVRGYLAFRISDGGSDYYYGYFDISMSRSGTGSGLGGTTASSFSMTIHGWAYNDVAGQSITIGASAVPGGAGLASLAVGALGLRGRRRSRSA